MVVTGDLTNLSLRPEFELARAILDGIPLGSEQVTVIPGNHDVYTLGALQQKLFRQLFAPYASSDGEPAVEFPLVRVRGEVAIVGLSTALPSPPPLADGWLGAAQLDALDDGARVARRQVPRRWRCTIRRTPTATRSCAGCATVGALQQVLARRGCELILHGHEHRDLRVTLPGRDGPIPVIGVGSGTYDDVRADRRARYNVYTIEGGRLVSVETRVHDAAAGRFATAATPPKDLRQAAPAQP